jgi:hypothetical protein
MRRYVWVPADVLAAGAPAALVVLVVLGAAAASAGAATALASTSLTSLAGAALDVLVAPAVPVVPAAPVVPVVPAVPVVPTVPAAAAVSVGLEGAVFRHPVTTMLFSELALALCGGDGVCAVTAAVTRPTRALHVPVQIVFFMLPPACATATIRPSHADQLYRIDACESSGSLSSKRPCKSSFLPVEAWLSSVGFL